MAIKVNTEAATDRYAMKLFIVQYIEPNTQFLNLIEYISYIRFSLLAILVMKIFKIFLETYSYLFFMNVKLNMVLRHDIIRSAKLRLTRK